MTGIGDKTLLLVHWGQLNCQRYQGLPENVLKRIGLQSTSCPSLMSCIYPPDCCCGSCCCVFYHVDCQNSICPLRIRMDDVCHTVVRIVDNCCDDFVWRMSDYPLDCRSCVVRLVVVPVPGRRCLVCVRLLRI